MLQVYVLCVFLFVALSSAVQDDTCDASTRASKDQQACLLKRAIEPNKVWDESSAESLSSARCTFPRVPLMTESQLDDFVRRSLPVVFEATPPDANAEFMRMCTKEWLLTHYGDHDVVLSSSNAHSYEKTQSTLAHYIEFNMKPQNLNASADQTKYQFGDNYLPGWDAFLAHYKRPPFLQSNDRGSLSWGMGGDGSGVPFHRHGPVFAEVLHGRKRWFLYQPSRPLPPLYHPNVTSLRWALESYPQLALFDLPEECVLRPGEILFIPDGWWHATLNLGQSSSFPRSSEGGKLVITARNSLN